MLKPGAADRFWRIVNKDGPIAHPELGPCWLWTRSIRENGYGQAPSPYGNPNPPMNAHRAAWLLTHGEIPDGLHVCHRCDVRACVRPDHLFLGTRFDNLLDASRKGRLGKPRKTHCIRGHAMTDDNIYIGGKGKTPRGSRTCAACKRAYNARWMRTVYKNRNRRATHRQESSQNSTAPDRSDAT